MIQKNKSQPTMKFKKRSPFNIALNNLQPKYFGRKDFYSSSYGPS